MKYKKHCLGEKKAMPGFKNYNAPRSIIIPFHFPWTFETPLSMGAFKKGLDVVLDFTQICVFI